MVILQIVAFVGGGHAVQIMFWGFLIVGLHLAYPESAGCGDSSCDWALSDPERGWRACLALERPTG